MAHIAKCLANTEPSSIICRTASPVSQSASAKTSEDSQPYLWRMQQPELPRKYQLFPRDKQLPALNHSKALDPETALAVTMAQSEKNERPSVVAGLRVMINQHNFARRRKASVPETGMMTTVHEIPMDSPTIPGRPPLHERSISAPGRHLQASRPTDTFYHCGSDDEEDYCAVIDEAYENPPPSRPIPMPVRKLTPLVIPEYNRSAPQLQIKRPFTHTRSGSTPIDVNRSIRTEPSPGRRFAGSGTTSAATSAGSSTSKLSSFMSMLTNTTTPISTTTVESNRVSPIPGDRRCQTALGVRSATPPQSGEVPRPNGAKLHHRRVGSDTSTRSEEAFSRRRMDGRNLHAFSSKAEDIEQTKTAEQKAFEELPRGLTHVEAAEKMTNEEVYRLRKHALGQIERFEVLKLGDVDALSKELRLLDERTEYLRRTYTSLRAGRRNLHTRICHYLRSPGLSKVSNESLLKQEEALAELDASIDDWVLKLERSENRRLRVRQKLLEHVAAAALLSTPNSAQTNSNTLQQLLGRPSPPVRDVSTPPRSPTKVSSASSSPVLSGGETTSPLRVVAQIPSTIFEEKSEVEAKDRAVSTNSFRRSDAESIRIYAGDDVYALFADVENEITRMSQATSKLPATIPAVVAAEGIRPDSTKGSPRMLEQSAIPDVQIISPAGSQSVEESSDPKPKSPPVLPKIESPFQSSEGAMVLLTNAVFRPGK